MSYILDALRRSQAERERGQVPGLHAQNATLAAAPAVARQRSWLWPALAVLGLLVLGSLVWALLRPSAPAAASASASATPAATPSEVLPPRVAKVPATAVAAPEVVAPQPHPQPQPLPLPIVVSAPVPPAPVPAAKAPPVAAPTKVAAEPEPTLLALAQLSAEQRRELPPLVLGGSIWSTSAASRFVIFNGQLVHEGESAAPGVTVERIAPKAAWLRWRELRIEWPL
jgi:general secretion pathway protein B